MKGLWDYEKKELEKTEEDKIKLLERQINYGPGVGKKVSLQEVKKYWNKLHLFALQKKLFELLLWGKTTTM